MPCKSRLHHKTVGGMWTMMCLSCEARNAHECASNSCLRTVDGMWRAMMKATHEAPAVIPIAREKGRVTQLVECNTLLEEVRLRLWVLRQYSCPCMWQHRCHYLAGHAPELTPSVHQLVCLSGP